MKLTNFTNAFVRIETDPYTLIMDPWTTDGIFDGGWSPYPGVDPSLALAGATHCLISHIHEDHCDFNALDRLPRNVKIIFPRIFPNHVIQFKIERMGFKDVHMIECGIPHEFSPGLNIEAVRPMNDHGHHVEQYEKQNISTFHSIDAGFIVTSAETRVVLLADNSPYNIADAGPSLERMKGCDLLAVPYNGFADDYPVCYDNFTLEEKQALSLRRSEKRFQLQTAAIRALAPRAILPYSSDFLVRGPRALEFIQVHPHGWLDRRTVADRYQECLGIPSIALDPCGALEIGPASLAVKNGNPLPAPIFLAEKIFSKIPNMQALYPNDISFEQIRTDFALATENMFSRMDAFGLASRWTVQFHLSDIERVLWVDLYSRRTGSGKIDADHLLICTLTSGYLQAHLDFKAHFNNSMISYNLSWNRWPNEHDEQLYKALNFLHKPISHA